MKLKLWSKFNHDFTNHGYLHRAVWKALYNFKIKRAQEARHNQLFFQNFQNNEISEIFKMLQNNSWINVYYTKSKHVFLGLLVLFSTGNSYFGVNLVQKLKIISLSRNFVPRLIQICKFLWEWVFCFWLEIPFWANFVQKFKIAGLGWNFALD